MNWFREPPVYSPVSPAALVRSMSGLIAAGDDTRNKAAALVAETFDAHTAVITDSGTSALIAALRDVVPRGGTIAYPSYACIDLTAAAVRAGTRVRLYDLDPTTLSPDLDSLRRTVSRGVDAIVVAHLYGYPADFAGVTEIADQAGVPVIEDAAQAAGGEFNGTRLGALADVSILSFGRGKGLTAGSGGAVLLRGARAVERAARIGRTLAPAQRGGREIFTLAAQWTLARPALYRFPSSLPMLQLGEMVYKEAREPRSISNVAATLIPAAIELGNDATAQRRAVARALISAMSNVGRVTAVRAVNGGEPGYLRLALLDRSGDMLPDERLGAIRGYPMTLDEHSQLAGLLHAGERTGPGGLMLRDRLFTMPTHSRVHRTDVARLISWISDTQIPVSAEAWAT